MLRDMQKTRILPHIPECRPEQRLKGELIDRPRRRAHKYLKSLVVAVVGFQHFHNDGVKAAFGCDRTGYLDCARDTATTSGMIWASTLASRSLRVAISARKKSATKVRSSPA
jgi:hypothetical protein